MSESITGKVRGLLCGSCNMAIGLFEENQEYLLSAIEYLKQYE
jgi:Recombination endonuclease VII